MALKVKNKSRWKRILKHFDNKRSAFSFAQKVGTVVYCCKDDGNGQVDPPDLSAGMGMTGGSSISQGGTTTGEAYISNIGGSDTIGLIEFSITAENEFVQLTFPNLPAGVNHIGTSVNGNNYPVYNFETNIVIIPGLANKLDVPFTFTDIKSVPPVVVVVVLDIHFGTGGETNTNNNSASAFVQIS